MIVKKTSCEKAVENKSATLERVSLHCELPLACQLPRVQMSSPSMMIKTHLLHNGVIVFLKKLMKFYFQLRFHEIIFLNFHYGRNHNFLSSKIFENPWKFKCDSIKSLASFYALSPKLQWAETPCQILPKALGICVLRSCTLFFIFDHSFLI